MSEPYEALKRLPPFRPVAVQLLKITGVAEATVDELAKLIEADPALSGEILALANSPLFSTSHELRSIFQAVSILGFDRIRAVVSTVAMRALVRRSRKSIALRNCWLHSIATALLAARMASAYGYDRNHAYTAGLLHDIGRFGLFGAFPERYPAVILSRYETTRDILEAERRFAAVDHCQAGMILSKMWRLPEDLANVTAHHHDEGAGQDGITPLIHLACLVSDALRFEAVRYNQVLHFDEIPGELPERLRAPFRFRLEDLEEYVIDHIYSLDSL